MTMYFIRHGETEWNKEDKIQGHKNSPLTEKGEEMARKIGAYSVPSTLIKLPHPANNPASIR